MSWFRRLFRPKPRRITLDAGLRKRIRVSFDEAASDEENFPATIDPRIYHVKLVLEHLGELNAGSALDLGCGKGRFARLVKQRWPDASMVGLDISPAMLSYAPSDILTAAGSMTALPFRDESFDAVYATESLEHAVEVDRAVAELCRVVKPGGRIVIIDKNSARWGQLETPEWERWFGRRELEKLLGRHCREVSSREISYWEDVAPDGLFLAWLAVK